MNKKRRNLANVLSASVLLLVALTGTARAQERPQLLVPLYAGAVGLQAYDAMSTLHALNRGAVERNPLMRGVVEHQIAFVGLKAGTAILTTYAAEHLWKAHHPKLAIVSMIVSNGIMAYVAERNTATLRRLR